MKHPSNSLHVNAVTEGEVSFRSDLSILRHHKHVFIGDQVLDDVCNHLGSLDTFFNGSVSLVANYLNLPNHSVHKILLPHVLFALVLEFLHDVDYHECVFLVVIKAHLHFLRLLLHFLLLLIVKDLYVINLDYYFYHLVLVACHLSFNLPFFVDVLLNPVWNLHIASDDVDV